MKPYLKYYLEFAKIRDVAAYNRQRAERRFLLVMEHEKCQVLELERLGSRHRRKKTTIEFCREYDLSIRTFYRWQRIFQRDGIEGLVTKFGKKKSEHADLKNIIAQKRPSKKSITATVKIDPYNPLLCLFQINEVIQGHQGISEHRKQAFGRLVDQLNIATTHDQAISLPRPLAKEEKELLIKYRDGTHKNQRIRAIALLMAEQEQTLQETMLATQRSRRTIYRWLQLFREAGLSFIETKATGGKRAELAQIRKTRVLDLIHSPPQTLGVQRASWTIPALAFAYQEKYSEHLPLGAVGRILKGEGYSWKKARRVLTSNDPKYRTKVEVLKKVFDGLREGDAFFFIDEAGPWAVKKYGGRSWMAPGEIRVVPAYQKSKGKIYWIAALEALTNQVVWRYIDGKNSLAVISILEMILDRYRAHSRIFVTWDALSSHNSKKVNSWIGAANFNARWDWHPQITVCPLPTCSQFLNVVETTFRNTRRAVIDNSDYQSVDEMKAAIDGFLMDRNSYFRRNPKKAGNKMWDKEIFNEEKWIEGLYRRM